MTAEVLGEPAYVVRGNQTVVRQHALTERLEKFHEALVEVLKRGAPDLLPSLEPPPPSESGYQLLPRMIHDAPPSPPVMPQVISYSWNWSDTLIAQQMAALDRLETDLAKLKAPAPSGMRAAYVGVTNGYKKVIDDRRMIDSDIDYNWLWQAAIARDRPGFDKITKRLDEVAELQKQGKPLTPEIIAEIGAVNPQTFVRIEPTVGHQRLIRVPIYTDVTDANFVQAFKRAVESAWRGRVGQEEIRLRLDIETITPRRLYCGSKDQLNVFAPNCAPPHKGEKIDLDAHLARFPKGRVVLTTGATTLRIMAGPSLVVSPHDVAPRVLAHEFGHIIGFPDAYFRGYRDLGADGFQVMELVTDSSDIMSSPGSGVVQTHHLEGLTAAQDIQSMMQAGLDALYKQNDPAAAAAKFRNVLERYPTHYGATFQLAKALDGAGNKFEALVWWKKMLEMAEAIGDVETATTVRTRLAREH